MNTQTQIEQILTARFSPNLLNLLNESGQHAGPATDSHFKVVIVSEAFESLGLVARHQAIYQALSALMPKPIHALALHTYTPQEWSDRKQVVPESAPCRGGSAKAEGQ